MGSSAENQGECEIFGELIATELKTLNQKQRPLAKHEIQNVLFRLTELAAKATMYSFSTSTSTSVVSSQSIAKPSYHPFQLPHSDSLGINRLEFF